VTRNLKQADSDTKYGKSRQQIIAAAEKLMAQKGVYATSLREINQVAKQKNASSIHYHFINRDGLIRAILESHISEVETHRLRMLEKTEKTYYLNDDKVLKTMDHEKRIVVIRELIKVFILPLKAKLETKSGRYYIKILQELIFSGKSEIAGTKAPQTFDDLINFTNGIKTTTTYILKLAPNLPLDVVLLRGKLIARLIITALADLIPDMEKVNLTSGSVLNRTKDLMPVDIDLVVENLTDVTVAIVLFPVSEPTMQLLRKTSVN
jgi:AcrR family transcriptional regulator